MPKIHVIQAFTLTHADGTAERFDVGIHAVSKEVAEHSYTAHHLAPADPADVAKAEKAEAKRLAAEKEAADKAAAELAEAQRIAAEQAAQGK